jgi:hypothetical protein
MDTTMRCTHPPVVQRIFWKCTAILCIAGCAVLASANDCFDDKSMALMQQGSPTLLYVWSPRMVLSAQHAASVQQQANLQGLRFVPLVDAQVPAQEVLIALRKMVASGAPAQQGSAFILKHSQALCSDTLLERDALRHFPTAFVLQPSGLHRLPIVGAMPPTAWAHSLQQRLAANAQAAPASPAAQ